MTDMKWFKIDPLQPEQIKPRSNYLVKTNGADWRDPDLIVWRGALVRARLVPSFVRGRPLWAAEITDPEGRQVITIDFVYENSGAENSVLIDDAIDRADAIAKARAWAGEPIRIVEAINPEAANQ